MPPSEKFRQNLTVVYQVVGLLAAGGTLLALILAGRGRFAWLSAETLWIQSLTFGLMVLWFMVANLLPLRNMRVKLRPIKEIGHQALLEVHNTGRTREFYATGEILRFEEHPKVSRRLQTLKLRWLGTSSEKVSVRRGGVQVLHLASSDLYGKDGSHIRPEWGQLSLHQQDYEPGLAVFALSAWSLGNEGKDEGRVRIYLLISVLTEHQGRWLPPPRPFRGVFVIETGTRGGLRVRRATSGEGFGLLLLRALGRLT